MNRAELVAAVDEGWRQLDAAIDGLDAAAMVEPGVVEAWSAIDLLGHVATWEQRALNYVERWRRGESPAPSFSTHPGGPSPCVVASFLVVGSPPQGGQGGPPASSGDFSVDAFNAEEAARRRDWSPQRVRDEAAETRRQLRATLQALGDDDWAAMVGAGSPEGTPRRPLGEWIGGALGGPLGQGTHAAEHAHHIRVWREARRSRRAGQVAALMEARRGLLRALAGASDDELTRRAGDGAWSIRDVLAHIAAWDGLLAGSIAAWLDGAAPPEPVGDIDLFNAQTAERASGEPVAATLIALAGAHEELLAAIERAGGRGGAFTYPWGEHGDLSQAADDEAGHEREHTKEIAAWRGSQS
jgi:hypothetical protein